MLLYRTIRNDCYENRQSLIHYGLSATIALNISIAYYAGLYQSSLYCQSFFYAIGAGGNTAFSIMAWAVIATASGSRYFSFNTAEYDHTKKQFIYRWGSFGLGSLIGYNCSIIWNADIKQCGENILISAISGMLTGTFIAAATVASTYLYNRVNHRGIQQQMPLNDIPIENGPQNMQI